VLSRFFQLSVFLLGLSLVSSAFDLRPLSKEQVSEDLGQIQRLVEEYYGPLQFKERNGKFELVKIIEEIEQDIQKSKSEPEALGALARALGKLNDGHVSIRFKEYASSPGQVKLPFFLTPVENRAIVAEVENSAKGLGIDVGDEVISIDGTPAMKFAEIASKYQSLGNSRSNQHLLVHATRRPTYMTEIVPQNAEARIVVKKADGKNDTIPLIWRPTSLYDKKILFVEPPQGERGYRLVVPFASQLNTTAQGTRLTMGDAYPFFLTDQNKQTHRLTQVYVNDDSLKKFGLERKDAPGIFAALYKHQDRNILLIRQPTYDLKDYGAYIQHYKAILDQFEPFADVLVIDQTHNPGGNSGYLEAFFRLFIKEKSASVVQFMRADRKWVRRFEDLARYVDKDLESESSRQLLLRAKMVEDANARGDFFISTPIPINQDPEVSPDPQYTWKKPLIVLTDELAGSCGDLFPLLMKKAGFKTFGQPTMGLGGSVEDVGELMHSGASVNLTRGLFVLYNPDGKYDEKDFAENTGVPVDEAYTHTVEDFRNGFVKYLEAASKFAVGQIK